MEFLTSELLNLRTSELLNLRTSEPLNFRTSVPQYPIINTTYFCKNNYYSRSADVKHCGADNTYCFTPSNK